VEAMPSEGYAEWRLCRVEAMPSGGYAKWGYAEWRLYRMEAMPGRGQVGRRQSGPKGKWAEGMEGSP
jgi:hypothetical protein